MTLADGNAITRPLVPRAPGWRRFATWLRFVVQGLRGFPMAKMHWRGPGFLAPRPVCGLDPVGCQTTRRQDDVTCESCRRVLRRIDEEGRHATAS